jgi:hypothetical protein
MNEPNRLALIEELEAKVTLKKNELRIAIEEGADNMVELMKGLTILVGLLLLLYLIFQTTAGRSGSGNTLSDRFASRLSPLLSVALQKGAAIFIGEAMDKLVDYLAVRGAVEDSNQADVSE